MLFKRSPVIFKKLNYYNSITLNKIFLFSFDYKFVFDSVCLGRDKLELEPLTKLALMADNAQAIGNGFFESSCNCGVRGNCWFHCKKAVDKELACVKNSEKKSDLLID